MKKRSLALVATCFICFILLAISLEYYESLKATIVTHYVEQFGGTHEDWSAKLDFIPFQCTLFGRIIIASVAISLSILFVTAFTKRKLKRKLFCFIVILSLLLLSIGARTCIADVWTGLPCGSGTDYQNININVTTLLIFDEECTDQNIRKYLYDVIFTQRTYGDIHSRLLDPWLRFHYLNITFQCVNGYNQIYDSDDTYYYSCDLLQEAIRKSGGVWDSKNEWWTWKNDKIDFLLVFSGQRMDLAGLSMEMWNAAIVGFNDPDVFGCRNVIIHELIHQFYVKHCGNVCIMNPYYCQLGCFTLCDECRNELMVHKLKWGIQ